MKRGEGNWDEVEQFVYVGGLDWIKLGWVGMDCMMYYLLFL